MVPLISQIDRVLNSTTGTVRILRDLAPRSIPPVQDGARKTANLATGPQSCWKIVLWWQNVESKILNFLDQDLSVQPPCFSRLFHFSLKGPFASLFWRIHAISNAKRFASRIETWICLTNFVSPLIAEKKHLTHAWYLTRQLRQPHWLCSHPKAFPLPRPWKSSRHLELLQLNSLHLGPVPRLLSSPWDEREGFPT